MRFIQDREAGLALRDYAADALCEETVDAATTIWEFQFASTEFDRRRLLQRIAALYLVDAAPMPVNVDSRTRQNALAEFTALKAGEPVPKTMYHDLMVRQQHVDDLLGGLS